jgi:hypothetical protein
VKISAGIPFPTQFYSSPLSRAAKTCEITWTGIIISSNNDRVHSDDADASEGNRGGPPKVMISEVGSNIFCLFLDLGSHDGCRTAAKCMGNIPVISDITRHGSRLVTLNSE